MAPNLWKCSFNLAMLFRSRGIFFNSSVSLNFFGKLSRDLTGVTWFSGTVSCTTLCWGGAAGCLGGGGSFSWGSAGALFFGSECITILSGMLGTVGPGAEIPGTENKKQSLEMSLKPTDKQHFRSLNLLSKPKSLTCTSLLMASGEGKISRGWTKWNIRNGRKLKFYTDDEVPLTSGCQVWLACTNFNSTGMQPGIITYKCKCWCNSCVMKNYEHSLTLAFGKH